ncbi:MAG TPA: response regulator transcription factor [Solirubrobacteraceae bacterium]|jgi:DNA-binding NarL/FixJ family response regulator
MTVTLVADEAPRESIGAVLGEQGWEFTEFDGVQDLLDSCSQDHDLVVLWIDSASPSLVRQVELLRRAFERARVVVICPEIERWEVRAALAAGAQGVVQKEQVADALDSCLRAVRAEQICVPKRHWRQIAPPALSTREKQILGLVVMGYMNGQIAEQLYLAESTVKSHLSSAFGKLGVRSRNEAVHLILDPERGLGMGILALGGEPLESTTVATR